MLTNIDTLKEVKILHIESATDVCSVAISVGDNILAVEETVDATAHSRNLILFVEKVLEETRTDKRTLDAVCFSAGPGSYTGLRIGASTAKGLAYSLNIPLISVSTLESVARGAKELFPDSDLLFCPMIDARRMEVFTAFFDAEMNRLDEISAKVVDETTFADVLSGNRVVFCGNGMPKCKELLSSHSNAIFCEKRLSSANMLRSALKKFSLKEFEDIAYFEPFYLKEYIAAKSHVKGLE